MNCATKRARLWVQETLPSVKLLLPPYVPRLCNRCYDTAGAAEMHGKWFGLR